MTRVNLLPWRKELREQRRKEFLIWLGVAVLLAASTVLFVHTQIASMISAQESRNAYLDGEIKEVNKKIREIAGLEKTKRDLLARMEVIQQLQKSRPQVVHLFDELARTLPDGVFLTRISQDGGVLTIQGDAQSNARVSRYMQNLDASAWLTDPKLKVIQTRRKGGSNERKSQFTLEVKEAEAANQGEVAS